MAAPEAAYTALLYRRMVMGHSPLLTPIVLRVAVLEKYLGRPGFSLLRTNTIGRLKREGAWSIDFGISPQEGLIYVSLGDMESKLPAEEQEHWLGHVVVLPLSQNYVKAQLSPGACIDDGDPRPW